MFSAKVVIFGHKWLYSCKIGCSSGKSGCIGAKLLYSGKVVVFGQSSCIRENGCVREKFFYSRECSCIWANVVVVGQKLLYSGKNAGL